MLFTEKYLGITVRMMIARLSIIFVYNGLNLFIPPFSVRSCPNRATAESSSIAFTGS